MTRKTTLTALITAATILANANAAQAFGWNMSWLTPHIFTPFSIVAPNN